MGKVLRMKLNEAGLNSQISRNVLAAALAESPLDEL